MTTPQHRLRLWCGEVLAELEELLVARCALGAVLDRLYPYCLLFQILCWCDSTLPTTRFSLATFRRHLHFTSCRG